MCCREVMSPVGLYHEHQANTTMLKALYRLPPAVLLLLQKRKIGGHLSEYLELKLGRAVSSSPFQACLQSAL